MTRLVITAALVLAAGALAADDKKDVPKDLAPFQGTWKVVKAEAGGQSAPKDEVDKMRFVFEGEKLTVEDSRKQETVPFSVDPKKDPAQMDLVSPKGDMVPGIYRFEKDGKLTLAFVKKGTKAERPKSFDGKDNPEAVILVLEKVKE